jgi:serine/threonine protein kinase
MSSHVDSAILAAFMAVQAVSPIFFYTWSFLVAEASGEIEGIKYIHSHGVIHYDLKPTNMLYGELTDKPSQVSIIDFGESWVEGDRPRTTFNGNAYFASPRQLQVCNGK